MKLNAKPKLISIQLEQLGNIKIIVNKIGIRNKFETSSFDKSRDSWGSILKI